MGAWASGAGSNCIAANQVVSPNIAGVMVAEAPFMVVVVVVLTVGSSAKAAVSELDMASAASLRIACPEIHTRAERVRRSSVACAS